jgi:glycosyltransferase involved in cell wall biosynthesis
MTIQNPTVSIVVPNYNYGHFLSECLDSMLAQTYTDWEVIVVDDTSTDRSVEIAQGYADRFPEKFRLIRFSDGPGGPPRAVNAGIAAMRGRYFGWLSSDDRCWPDRLERSVAALESRPEAGLVHGAYRHIDNDGNTGGITIPPEVEGVEAFFRLLQGNIINGSTVLVRKELLDKTGPLLETDPEVPDLHRVSEYLLWLDLSLLADVALIKEPVEDYRIHSLNHEYNSSRLGPVLVQIGKRRVLRKHGLDTVVSRICERNGNSRKDVYARLASVLLSDPYAEDLPIFLEALQREGLEEAGAVGDTARRIQSKEDQRRILHFHLNSTAATPRVVLQTLREPTPEVEAILVRLLNQAKAVFNQGGERNLKTAIGEFHAILDASHLFPYLDLSARFYLAMALEQTGDESRAAEQYRRVLELEPGHARARQNMDRLLESVAP